MRSIRSFLMIVILSTITLMAFLTALNGYRDSMAMAEQVFDAELIDKAHMLSMILTYNPVADLAPIAETETQAMMTEYTAVRNKTMHLSNDFFVFQIWQGEKLLLSSPQAPKQVMVNFQQGFQDRNFAHQRWRVYSFFNSREKIWVLTAERMDIRYLLAENIVLETILPIVLMLPFLGILIWTIISYGLSPLRHLAKELSNRRVDDLQALAIDKQPVELIQVVNSTNDLFARLKAAFLREKRFASDAAHELRTPISAIKIHLHNIAPLVPDDDSSFKLLQLSVDRMGHIVEQILNLNRTSIEQYVTRFVQIDVYQLAQEIIVKQYHQFEQKQLKISLEGVSCWVNGDQFALEMLLENLLTNAAKYTPEGGSVLVRINSLDNKIQLAVEDSGPGVPEDQYERLFDRFYRLDGDCHASGTIGCGLGLAIVQQIIELHNARIFLEKSSFTTGLKVNVFFSKEHCND